MNNPTLRLPSEFAETISNRDLETVTFGNGEERYTFAPSLDSLQFMDRFPNHRRISGLLDSSGSSWNENAFVFYVADCFDPPLYVQFGKSFEDCYESFCDNEPTLVITPEEAKDYEGLGEGQNPEDYQGSYTSDGKPIDTDNVQGITNPLTLVALTFAN